jgi:DNA-binding response OmpR family regulator
MSTQPAGAKHADEFRVLIVDDHRDCADSACAALETLCYCAVAAYDIENALKLAESYQPDVMLLDIAMPGGGLTVAEHARSLPNSPMIIAVSGYGSGEARAKAKEAGVTMYVFKPLNIELLDRILTYVREKRNRKRR